MLKNVPAPVREVSGGLVLAAAPVQEVSGGLVLAAAPVQEVSGGLVLAAAPVQEVSGGLVLAPAPVQQLDNMYFRCFEAISERKSPLFRLSKPIFLYFCRKF